ncbi:unnamed protein product [Ilex paraguariensis]|uniref:Uncharacterized protein n=1 Tax=Ilex paraguariensis TaxID=185542 RepID=A0ABC8SL61_9AQUA
MEEDKGVAKGKRMEKGKGVAKGEGVGDRGTIYGEEYDTDELVSLSGSSSEGEEGGKSKIRRRNNGSQYEPTILSTKSVKKPSASTSIQYGWRAPSASTSIQSSWRAPSASISIQSAWRAPSASTFIQFAWRAPSASQKSTWNTPSNASKSS